MKAAVQVLKQAEDLKAKVSGDILNDNEAWTSHQKLQDLYQQLLVMDLEYALDKKVEQDLWNHVFKNQINALQNQAKDKKNPRRTESQGNLAWFLESASGFYLQLLQELCDAFDLDLPCRRKGSVYGIIKGSKTVNCNITPPQKSSCLYVCQHCLVHLGDIARYRNQSLQAETFYRHAAQLVPSNGQPYNQLAILEAAKGEKLSMVFYYVRSIAVKHPFPVASTNLQKIFAKITGDDLNIEGKAKVSVYDYINTFLQFHSLVHMTSDLVRAEKLLKVLASNLSTLIATESLSSWKLIQMIAINLFAVAHATRTLELQSGDKKENGSDGGSEALSDEETKVYNLMLELLASVLNGILLLVYTMKDENTFKDYYALPVVKLILDWVQQDLEILHSQPFANKLQIWPSLCKLLNGIQFGATDNFDATKYEDVPLPEDWDLQCFLPLSKVHRQFKFKEATPRLTEEEETKLRTHRLISHGMWICDQEVSGKKLMTVRNWGGEGGKTTLAFEAIIQQAPSTEVLLQLEEVSVSKGSRNGHLFVETFADSSSNSVGSQETTAQAQDTRSDSSDFGGAVVKAPLEKSYQGDREKISHGVMKDKGNKLENGKSPTSSSSTWVGEDRVKEKRTTIEKPGGSGGDRKENSRPTVYLRERKLRQNVAMQTIMQKKYPIPKNESLIDSVGPAMKPKVESKQVTFKTPSPSPPASSDGTPPQTATPPQPPALQTNAHMTPCIDTMMTAFPPLQSVYQQMPNANSFVAPGQKAMAYNMQQVPPNRMAMTFPGTLQNQNSALQDPISAATSGYTSARLVYSSLPTTSGPPAYNSHVYNPSPQQPPPGTEYHPIPMPPQQPQQSPYCNQLKEPMAVTTTLSLKQPGATNNCLNPQQQTVPPPSFIYSQQMSPAQQKQAFSFAEPTAPSLYGQQVQWFQPPPPQMKEPSFFGASQVGGNGNVNPVAPQLQALSPGGYHHPMYAAGQPQVQGRNPMSENVVFQLQATPPSAYSFPVQVAPPVTPGKAADLQSLANVIGNVGGTGTEKMGSSSQMQGGRLDAEAGGNAGGSGGGGELITNTYSLFNSPWSSGLNSSSAGNSNEETFGVSLATSNAQPSSGSSNFGSFMQPALQSLWSGPGPSPLERLLEQQKQKRDTAPQ